MLITEEDKQACGWTDMRAFREWVDAAPFVLSVLARLWPPSVYVMQAQNGARVRVVPDSYRIDDHGNPVIDVIMATEINPELPLLQHVRITGVPPGRLSPVKWPLTAPVH